MKRKWIKILLGLTLSLSLLVSCSSDEQGQDPTNPTLPPTTSSPAPNPSTPNPTTPSTPNPTQPGGVPDLSSAVPVELGDRVNYSALSDLASDFSAPIVGDPLVQFELNQSSTSFSGNILFAFEDQIGFWGAQIPVFEPTATLNSNALDVIFADDELVFRTVAMRNSNALGGFLYYRVRQPGEDQCKTITVTCNVSNSSQTCTPAPIDVTTPCRTYMSLNDPNVKFLGSFSGNLGDWLK